MAAGRRSTGKMKRGAPIRRGDDDGDDGRGRPGRKRGGVDPTLIGLGVAIPVILLVAVILFANRKAPPMEPVAAPRPKPAAPAAPAAPAPAAKPAKKPGADEDADAPVAPAKVGPKGKESEEDDSETVSEEELAKREREMAEREKAWMNELGSKGGGGGGAAPEPKDEPPPMDEPPADEPPADEPKDGE